MVCSTDRSKAVVPVLVLLFVALWFILRGDSLYVVPCVILFLRFSVLLVLWLPRLGKRELILVLFVRLFGLCLFGFVGFLFLLGSGNGRSLWLWHSLDFSLTFFYLTLFLSFSLSVSLSFSFHHYSWSKCKKCSRNHKETREIKLSLSLYLSEPLSLSLWTEQNINFITPQVNRRDKVRYEMWEYARWPQTIFKCSVEFYAVTVVS